MDCFDHINARQFIDFKSINNEDEDIDTFFDTEITDETLVCTNKLLPTTNEDCRREKDIERGNSTTQPHPLVVIDDDDNDDDKNDIERGNSTTPPHSLVVIDDDDDDDKNDFEKAATGLSDTSTEDFLFHDEDKGNSPTGQENFRRSMSVGDMVYLQMVQENPKIWESQESVSSSTTSDVSKKKKISKKSPKKFSYNKRQFGSDRTLNSYVSLAEAVRNFQIGTPERFRSRSKTDLKTQTGVFPLKTTVPQSPHLICNKRHRPVQFLSHEEEELKEFKEAQKFKFKAHPVDKNILHGSSFSSICGNSRVDKKPVTIPEPFHLTSVKAKAPEVPPKKEPEFHAKPVPNFQKPPLKKHLYQKSVTKPQTPTFMRRPKSSKSQICVEPIKAKPCQYRPLPESFQLRNDFLLKRKERFINQFIEEEKKAREFHARPVPKSILSSPMTSKNSTKTVQLRSKITEQKLRSKSTENISVSVKPKSLTCTGPVVKKPLTEIQEFMLSTDLRAKERKAFGEELQAKYEKVEQLKQMDQERRLKEEREEFIKLRKKAEVKAQPIKKYKELQIQPSGKVTQPISPKFHSTSKKEEKENDNS